MDGNWIYLDAENVKAASAKILDLLRQDTETNSFWFYGWKGLGASSVLRAITGFLKSASCDSSTRNHFGRIIHVDCSMWKSRRAMQKIIVQELGLHDVMPLFDKEDEDDDFRGVEDSLRGEIRSIGKAIWKCLVNEKFLVTFLCGIDEDIKLEEFGIPLQFGTAKVLWTNHRRFQLLGYRLVWSRSFLTDYLKRQYLICASGRSLTDEAYLLLAFHEEAVELTRYTGMDKINRDLILECYKYLVFLIRQRIWPLDHATHVCNYWVCDGILQGDTAWEIGDALQGLLVTRTSYNMLQVYRDQLYEVLGMRLKMEKWFSSSGDEYEPPKRKSTTYFLDGHHRQELQIESFQQAKNLRVLKLCNCGFDFSSPPFLCCQNLRFLWLDTCTDNRKEQDIVPSCFPNLWVFDLRFTEYVYLPQVAEMMRDLRELNAKGVSWRIISQAWTKLQNLHKLRVTVESSEVITRDSCFPTDMMSLELLDMSGNTPLQSLPDLSLAQRLKMLVLDGCSSLEQVRLERAPMLETFSFDGYGQVKQWTNSLHLPKQELRPKTSVAAAEAKVSNISLEGCSRLHSIFLRALHNLQELNLSGTAIRRLHLAAVDIPRLKNVFLLGCEKLQSLLWNGYNPRLEVLSQVTPELLEVLHVDTRGNSRKARSVMCCREQKNFKFAADVTFLDGRFVWSVMRAIYGRINHADRVHLHISSTVNTQVHIAKNIKDIVPNKAYSVATGPFLPLYMDAHFAEDVAHQGLLWDYRQLKLLNYHLQIGEGSYNLESMKDDVYFSRFTTFYTTSLHVHDNSSITAIPPSLWIRLEWCHVERCPKLQTLFTFDSSEEKFNEQFGLQPRPEYFTYLATFSAIDLPMAHCTWGKGICNIQRRHTYCFERLQHIYLSNCPRLVYVLPVSFDLPSLETIQIEYCSNLKCIFPLDDGYPKDIEDLVVFSNLKRIKLRYLHNMKQICEARVSFAPELEMISVRDCWALRRLPAISDEYGQRPIVEGEKDWWDKLEWDGLEANHHPSRFQARHSSRYYKKTILRASVLR